jgi:hypothetical protein
LITKTQQARIATILSIATGRYSSTRRITRIVRDPDGRIYVEVADAQLNARRGYVEVLPDGELLAGQRIGKHAADLTTIVDVGSESQAAQQLAAVGYKVDGGTSGNRQVIRWRGGVGEYVGSVTYTDAWYAFRAGSERMADALGHAKTPEAAALFLAGWHAGFDPEKVSLERHRRSVTQGEVSVSYDGQVLERYGDDIRIITDRDDVIGSPGGPLERWRRAEIVEGDGRQVVGGFAGLPDSFWMEVAQRDLGVLREREHRRTAALLATVVTCWPGSG